MEAPTTEKFSKKPDEKSFQPTKDAIREYLDSTEFLLVAETPNGGAVIWENLSNADLIRCLCLTCEAMMHTKENSEERHLLATHILEALKIELGEWLPKNENESVCIE